MKNYNIKNYVRYKKDVSCSSENLEAKCGMNIPETS
jgi:hypothetical protein